MATSVHTFNDSNKKLHWQEQYVSEGINKKLTAESQGIVRGFELAAQSPFPVANQFRLLPDAAKGDGVICLRNVDNRVVTLLQGGPAGITIDMSGVAIGEYWICAWTDYSIGATTDARIYLLTTAELSNPTYSGRIVVIGWVNYDGITNLDPNPAAGLPTLAPSAAFVPMPGGSPAAMREIAALKDSKGHMAWQKAVRFGRADEYVEQVGLAVPITSDWIQHNPTNLAGVNQGRMRIQTTDPYRGKLHFAVDAQSDGLGSAIVGLVQKSVVPVQDGDIIRMRMKYKVPAAVAGGWQVGIYVIFLDENGNIVYTGTEGTIRTDLGGAATGTYLELRDMTHVIAGRGIQYILPAIFIRNNNLAAVPVWFYFDDIDFEVLSGGGPEVDPMPDGLEEAAQPIRSSSLVVLDAKFTGGPPATAVDLKAWKLENDPTDATQRALLLRRLDLVAAPPYPLLRLGTVGLQAGLGVPGSGARHRKALYEQNTPRAWATLRWNGVAIAVVDGYGIASVASLGVGYYRITLDTDEDGNPWLQDLDYSVSLGTLHGSVIPATGRMVEVVAKGVVPNTFDIVYRFDTGVGGQWAPGDPAIPGDEIYVQVFAAD